MLILYCSFFYYARKPESASNSGSAEDDVSWEESIDRDEEDEGHQSRPANATSTPSAPLPTTTDATQASVDQLAAIATKDDNPLKTTIVNSTTQDLTPGPSHSETETPSAKTSDSQA
jgi:hypothetical protein